MIINYLFLVNVEKVVGGHEHDLLNLNLHLFSSITTIIVNIENKYYTNGVVIMINIST